MPLRCHASGHGGGTWQPLSSMVVSVVSVHAVHPTLSLLPCMTENRQSSLIWLLPQQRNLQQPAVLPDSYIALSRKACMRAGAEAYRI